MYWLILQYLLGCVGGLTIKLNLLDSFHRSYSSKRFLIVYYVEKERSADGIDTGSDASMDIKYQTFV